MNLKEARFKRGMTQFDLRLKSGIHQSKISLFEKGYVIPNDDEKIRISNALNIRIDAIEWTKGDGNGVCK